MEIRNARSHFSGTDNPQTYETQTYITKRTEADVHVFFDYDVN